MKELRIKLTERGTGHPFMEAVGESVLGTGWTVHPPDGDEIGQMARFWGPAPDIGHLETVLEGDPRPPLRAVDILERTANSIRAVFTWRRPSIDDPATPEKLFATLVWTPMLLTVRLQERAILVRALHEDCDRLDAFFEEIHDEFAGTFEVELLRAGEIDRDWSSTPGPLDDRLLAVLRHATANGYYEDPRRCSIRDLGESLGMSKSAVARHLREIERIAVARLQRDANLARLDPIPGKEAREMSHQS